MKIWNDWELYKNDDNDDDIRLWRHFAPYWMMTMLNQVVFYRGHSRKQELSGWLHMIGCWVQVISLYTHPSFIIVLVSHSWFLHISWKTIVLFFSFPLYTTVCFEFKAIVNTVDINYFWLNNSCNVVLIIIPYSIVWPYRCGFLILI